MQAQGQFFLSGFYFNHINLSIHVIIYLNLFLLLFYSIPTSQGVTYFVYMKSAQQIKSDILTDQYYC